MNAKRVASGAGWGALGGAAGAFLGFAAVALAHQGYRLGDANEFLKGPNGPPFFDLTLATAAYYACLGAALARGKRRIVAAGLGIVCIFLALASPMAIATRLFSWGQDPQNPTLAWVYLILGAYAVANLAAVAALGGLSERSASWRGALGGVLGACAAAGVEWLLRRFVPGYAISFTGALRGVPVSALVSGALWGALIGGGAALAGPSRQEQR